MDLIDRREAMAELYDVFFDDDLKATYPDKADVVLDVIRKLPSAQSDEKRTEERTKTHACDLISRSAAITAIQKAYADTEGGTDKCAVWKNVGLTNALHIMQDLPSAQPDVPDTNVGDMIYRQAAIDTEGLDEQIRCEICRNPMHTDRGCDGNCKYDEKLYERIMQILDERIKPLPSAQAEPFTDKEQRIFLAAMGREEKVCEEVDRNHVREPYEDSLMRVCREIKRKVKGALWT